MGSYTVSSESDSVEGTARVTVVTRSVRSSGVQPTGESTGISTNVPRYPKVAPQHVQRRYRKGYIFSLSLPG